MSFIEQGDSDIFSMSQLFENLTTTPTARGFRERSESLNLPQRKEIQRVRRISVDSTAAEADPPLTPIYGGGGYPERVRLQPAVLDTTRTAATPYKGAR